MLLESSEEKLPQLAERPFHVLSSTPFSAPASRLRTGNDDSRQERTTTQSGTVGSLPSISRKCSKPQTATLQTKTPAKKSCCLSRPSRGQDACASFSGTNVPRAYSLHTCHVMVSPLFRFNTFKSDQAAGAARALAAHDEHERERHRRRPRRRNGPDRAYPGAIV